MNATAWNCEPAFRDNEFAVSGKTVSEIEAETERLGCNAYRVAVDGGSMTFRKLAGEWVQTS